jgi:hypothetical protein
MSTAGHSRIDCASCHLVSLGSRSQEQKGAVKEHKGAMKEQKRAALRGLFE